MSNIVKSFKDLPPNIVCQLYEDPVFFARFVFDSYLWSKQREICRALLKFKRVAVYSCTGSGKSYLCSNLLPFFLQTKENSISVVVGANYKQTIRSVWRSVCTMYTKARIPLLGEPDSTKWVIGRGQWYSEVLSARRIESLQGLHAPYILQVAEEASGCDEMVFDAFDGNSTSANCYQLYIGNPLRPQGRFYETLYDPTFYKVNISIFDTPLFSGEIDEIPEPYKSRLKLLLPNEEYVKNAEIKYGKGSAFWKAKVLGQFPMEDDYSLFNINDIEYAFENEDVERDGEKILTVDCARFGGDESVFCSFIGFYNDEMVTIKKNDTMAIVGQIVNMDKENEYDYIVIDETGLGVGVVDRLIELGFTNVIGVNFSENAFDEETYSNIGTEMFFNLAKALKDKKVRLVGSDKLKKQLMAFFYTFDSRGKFRICDMQTLKKQILKESPDRAVACALRFCVIQPRVGIR